MSERCPRCNAGTWDFVLVNRRDDDMWFWRCNKCGYKGGELKYPHEPNKEPK